MPSLETLARKRLDELEALGMAILAVRKDEIVDDMLDGEFWLDAILRQAKFIQSQFD